MQPLPAVVLRHDPPEVPEESNPLARRHSVAAPMCFPVMPGSDRPASRQVQECRLVRSHELAAVGVEEAAEEVRPQAAVFWPLAALSMVWFLRPLEEALAPVSVPAPAKAL